jgi:hypothetical protein
MDECVLNIALEFKVTNFFILIPKAQKGVALPSMLQEYNPFRATWPYTLCPHTPISRDFFNYFPYLQYF